MVKLCKQNRILLTIHCKSVICTNISSWATTRTKGIILLDRTLSITSGSGTWKKASVGTYESQVLTSIIQGRGEGSGFWRQIARTRTTTQPPGRAARRINIEISVAFQTNKLHEWGPPPRRATQGGGGRYRRGRRLNDLSREG